jgi:hypothetical protein
VLEDKDMKVISSMIDRDLRIRGRMIKLVNNTFTESRLRLFNILTNKMKNMIKDNSIQCIKEWIPRRTVRRCEFAFINLWIPKENVPEFYGSMERLCTESSRTGSDNGKKAY